MAAAECKAVAERPVTLATRIYRKFPDPEYATLVEVRNGTGWNRVTRSADALAMSLWPSRGLHLHGFEIKASRSDWLRELKNPAKADEIALFCDFWWVVAGNEDIVKRDELPPTWGLMVPYRDGLKVIVPAPRAEDTKPITRSFLGAILRKAFSVEAVASKIEDTIAALKEAHERDKASSRSYERDQLKSLREAVRLFEEKSGVRISEYDGGKIGEAVAAVRNGGVDRQADTLRIVNRHARILLESTEKVLAEIGAKAEDD